MTVGPDESMAYVAKCRTCGAIVMACTDNPATIAKNADDIADCIRLGYVVEHVTAQYVRDHWTACLCAANQPQQTQLELTL
jgi:hypothetical protein